MPNALIALAKSRLKCLRRWLTSDLDDVLLHGDRLYREISHTSSCAYLLAEELPTSFKVRRIQYALELKEPKAGFIFKANDPPYSNLKTALDNCYMAGNESDFTGCLIVLGVFTVAIMTSVDPLGICEYYIFDPHCRDSFGLFSPTALTSNTGTSVLVCAGHNTADVASFLQMLARSLSMSCDTQYELIPTKIKVETWSESSCKTHANESKIQLKNAEGPKQLYSEVAQETIKRAPTPSQRTPTSANHGKRKMLAVGQHSLMDFFSQPLLKHFNSNKHTTSTPLPSSSGNQSRGSEADGVSKARHQSGGSEADGVSRPSKSTDSQPLFPPTKVHIATKAKQCSVKKRHIFQTG